MVTLFEPQPWASPLGITGYNTYLTSLHSTYLSVNDWGTHIAKKEFTWICTKSAPSFTFLRGMVSEPENAHNPTTTCRRGRRMSAEKSRTYCSGCLRRDQGGLCRCLLCWEPPPSTGSPARRILCTQSDNPTAERGHTTQVWASHNHR